MAVPFDPDRLTVNGTSVAVIEGVVQSTVGAAQYGISDNGALVYVPGRVSIAQRRLVWVGRNGTEQPSDAPPHNYVYPRLSPDGRRLAVVLAEQGNQIWQYDLARDTLTRLTFQGSFNLLGPWTPDGKQIAFSSNKEGALNIFWQLADGSGGLERLATSEFVQVPESWSPDRQLLAFTEINPVTGRDIWVLQMSDGKAQPFLRSPFNEWNPRFSPDGRWIAYDSDESGRSEVYVQPYPGPGGKWQASRDGGTEPVWNRNGRELFYRTGNKIMTVEITTQPNFALGNPRMLFEGLYEPSVGASSNYDVSPDGQRFLMVKQNEQAQTAPTQINVVLNWFEELKQKVPVGKK